MENNEICGILVHANTQDGSHLCDRFQRICSGFQSGYIYLHGLQCDGQSFGRRPMSAELALEMRLTKTPLSGGRRSGAGDRHRLFSRPH